MACLWPTLSGLLLWLVSAYLVWTASMASLWPTLSGLLVGLVSGLLELDFESLGAHVEPIEGLDGVLGTFPAPVGHKTYKEKFCKILTFLASFRQTFVLCGVKSKPKHNYEDSGR